MSDDVPPMPKTVLDSRWVEAPGGSHVFCVEVDGQRVVAISMATHTQFPGLIKYICYGLKMWADRRDSVEGGKLR